RTMLLRAALSLFLAGVALACSPAGAEDEAVLNDTGDEVARDHDAQGQGAGDRDASAGEGCAGRGVRLDGLHTTSDSGTSLRVSDVEPARMVAGDHAWTIELTRDGEPLEGLSDELHVTPFMPDHGHGTAVVVEIDELDAGRYRLSD